VKLSFAYTVYNGTELLKHSIKQIENIVDDIIICYQTVSNRGNLNLQLEKELIKLSVKKKVRLIRFNPNLNLDTKTNELNKHNIMLNAARDSGSTHIIVGATDHFYKPDELKAAIAKSVNFDCTFTSMYTYYKHPTWQITPLEDYMMPLVMKIYSQTKFERRVNYPVRVDPSVKVNTCGKYHVFPESEIMLHHYSMVREDIMNKWKNAASPTFERLASEGYIDEWNNYDIELNQGVKYFHGRKIRIVDNYFDI
jgi:hypothetical protein